MSDRLEDSGEIYLVQASNKIYTGLIVGAYDNPEAAVEHVAFVDSVDNDFRAVAKRIPLRSAFDPERGMDYTQPIERR